MKIKYSPQYSHSRWSFTVIDNNTLRINISGNPQGFTGDTFYFDPLLIEYDPIRPWIMEAHRDGGELYVTILRWYSGSCSDWDDGQYHEVAE